ncbi:MAG: DNA-binding transcriptional response regulator, NtrC family [Chloroflexi bacterium AL-W]|nr:DNA-binding transcriptional response regulator, NtrC family [Chloroflexi bacterium AL-N1]NOK69941.1 DNA-binding transcriptional response regulator, NtrC family [Chloroflexi bacterium AL-N10]NOK73763.1 DNA-binding transcriptional response regulator, NtrC family [Chloroflexi bacterium AL-N5]NOK85473.1 DNA-binding transcriptional response regulator, NtrC family [Chloroflexi bacterium AL-W]NOK91674.1 DNA-binding transcriptional response regulator, NtrC family [Chloroflexi bacterium AL-N15]
MARGSKHYQKHILVADDDDGLRELLSDLLSEEGYHVETISTGDELITRLQESDQSHDLFILDLMMPGMSGLEVLERLSADGDDTPVIVITGFDTSSNTIRAMQMGAYDYIQKPFDNDEVLVTVRRLFEHQALASRVHDLEQRAELRERMIGRSPAMRETYKTIGRVAASDASVLITGETGTGKELVANILHQNSSRAKGPLIKVNCAALPETLIESELFGHEKGSFTGALNQRKGRFELANQGTILLDEVGEISLPVQKKLLRVLQEGEIERVGGSNVIHVDVRVLAATNRNLIEEVKRGVFREDLYYRLNVINIQMPPLRERRGDIALLVEHFLEKYRYKSDAPPTKISEEAMQRLEEYDWPGNVRQIENEIERAVVLSQGKVITSQILSLAAQDLPTQIDLGTRVRNREGLSSVLEKVERVMLHEALRQSDGDEEEAARLLDLSIDQLKTHLQRIETGS